MTSTMLFPAPAGSDRAQALAAEVGCTVGEFSPPFGHMKPALLGKVAGFSKALETFGGRFDRRQRVYVFPSWPTLEVALRLVLEQRDGSMPAT
jgi:hypothetical protein